MESGFGQDLLNADVQLDGDRVFDDDERKKILKPVDPDVLEVPRVNITPTKVSDLLFGHLPIDYYTGVPKTVRF